jgi:endonuclease/exonuclease/phosphatase family metal-dependent hydrolase
MTGARWILGVATVGLVALGLAGCEPLANDFDEPVQEAPIFRASRVIPPSDPSPAKLRVVAWNIKFGGARIDFFFDKWGDRVHMTVPEVLGNMERVAALVREVDPDLLIVEECDVNGKRSAYVDQLRFLLEHTKLGYGAYFSTWDSRYVAYDGMGRIDEGVAILSKYRIVEATRIKSVDRTDQGYLTKKFYLHRAIGRAVVELGAQRVAVFAVHAEAYDQDGTKQKQIAQVLELARRETLPFVIGGDFNELPPGAVKTTGFPDEHPSAKGTEFEQPPYTPEVMRPFFDELVPYIPLSDYGATAESQGRYFSHTVAGPNVIDLTGQPGFWNRTLDYLFASRGTSWASGESDVLQRNGRMGIVSDPLWLSDHAPVVGSWVLR